jgi:hypothetical protein
MTRADLITLIAFAVVALFEAWAVWRIHGRGRR